MNIEHGTFTPLVFSVNGVMSKECPMFHPWFHKYLAQKIANKTNERYEKIIAIIRCKLSFMILRSCLMCIRGKTTTNIDDFEIVFDNARSWPDLHRKNSNLSVCKVMVWQENVPKCYI